MTGVADSDRITRIGKKSIWNGAVTYASDPLLETLSLLSKRLTLILYPDCAIILRISLLQLSGPGQVNLAYG